MTDRLEWIEKAGIENMKLHHVCADNLAKDSATTLTVLLAGIGGSLAYAIKAFEGGSWTWIMAGATALTMWLVILGFYLVTKCLMATPIPQIYNEPKNLNAEGFSFDALREAELENLQERIAKAGARNKELAKHLNRARTLAVCSPGVFILASGLYSAWVAWAAAHA
ncbi:hypothetical protein [Herbaspirillum huttiense]|uniref:hypothetical protein n=1 Tax=Herbaspirillum huttiense TaxID=863372 RepID=UPI0031E3F92C